MYRRDEMSWYRGYGAYHDIFGIVCIGTVFFFWPLVATTVVVAVTTGSWRLALAVPIAALVVSIVVFASTRFASTRSCRVRVQGSDL